MRIIAGEAKGRRLKMVPGVKVRPTTDRVRESLFQRPPATLRGDGSWICLRAAAPSAWRHSAGELSEGCLLKPFPGKCEDGEAKSPAGGICGSGGGLDKGCQGSFTCVGSSKTFLSVHIFGFALPGNIFAGSPDVYFRTRFIGIPGNPDGGTRSRLPSSIPIQPSVMVRSWSTVIQ